MNVSDPTTPLAATEEFDRALAERVRLLRSSTATQAELADRMNALGLEWTPNTVALVEAGRRRLKPLEVFGIAFALNVKLGEFFEGGGMKTRRPQDSGSVAEGDTLPDGDVTYWPDRSPNTWKFVRSYIAGSCSESERLEPGSAGFEVAGVYFDSYQEALDHLDIQAEEHRLDRLRKALEDYFSNAISERTGATSVEEVQSVALMTYGHDLLTEREERFSKWMNEHQDTSRMKQQVGHITRQMLREVSSAITHPFEDPADVEAHARMKSAANGDPWAKAPDPWATDDDNSAPF